MKIIMTGALGHIGSSLIRYLGSEIPHAQLLLIDNPKHAKILLANGPSKRSQLFILSHDVREANLENAFSDADVVIHLAAKTDAESSVDDPIEVEKNNLVATKL